MVKSAPLPDHIRCHRTDGRQWRCNRHIMAGRKLCEVHHLQGQHRQKKETVPESLKIQRQPCKKMKKRVKKTLKIVRRKRENAGASEALDGALKKMKLKRGDLHLELIRVFLKRQVEKKKERELEKNDDMEERELPNGLMEISPGRNLDNMNVFCNVRVGLDSNSISMRRFRSKNIEPIPIGTTKVLPFAQDVSKLKKKNRKKCHWCRKISYCSLVQCSSCKKEWFCRECISLRCSTTEEQVKTKCPVCQKTCICRSCLRSQSEDKKHKKLACKENNVGKIQKLQYLIRMLLPVLKQLNLEQRTQLESEARLKGGIIPELQIRQAESNCTQQNFCNNCQSSIVDIHRSCKNCQYNLCLRCSELCQGSLKAFLTKCGNTSKPPKSKKSKVNPTQDLGYKNSLSLEWEACETDGNLICPPKAFGGCDDGSLELRSILPSGWMEEIESRAEEIVQNFKFQEITLYFCSCGTKDDSEGIKASSRKKSEDNILYYPYADEFCGKKIEHFRIHWGEGHPVIVRRVIKQLRRNLSWNPIIMLCSYLEKTSTRSRNTNSGASKVTNCLDWCELEICRKQIFMGSLEGQSNVNMRDETLKLKLWISSSVFREQFPKHYAEILSALPLQEYMNPISGLYNLASNLPCDTDKSDFGPSIHISFGGPEDFMRADLVTKLFCNHYDMVNILVHATDVPISTEELTKIKSLMKKNSTQDQNHPAKNDNDHTMENESEISGNSEESSLQNVEENLPLHNNGEEDESESDCEPSIRWSGINLSSEESDDQKILESHNKSSNYLGDDRVTDSCGAQWDVFRRQDVPKLVEYLSRHSNEFSQINCLPENIIHPIYDQCFYLDAIHKFRLKEEFDIEPWTFKQHLGEAVIVPAGCPFQIRCLKSCVNVVLDFISPENVSEGIKLIGERRMLPQEHKARKNLVEVKKMTLDSIYAAVEEIQNI